MYEATDEAGWSWVVEKGDPAEAACKVLERAGFRRLVLPRALLADGETRSMTQADVDQAETALAGLTLIDQVSAGVSKRMRQTAERRVRLLECIKVLT